MRKQISTSYSRRCEEGVRSGAQVPAVELGLKRVARLARGVGDQPNRQAGAAQAIEGGERPRQQGLTDGDHAADVEQNTLDHARPPLMGEPQTVALTFATVTRRCAVVHCNEVVDELFRPTAPRRVQR